MRLRRLRLHRYGCFDDLDLPLAGEPGRLTMVVAPNGAGKSVLRRAFHDLLFDIPVQSPMKFRHGYAGMALHADAIAADGGAFGFGWVRGGKPPRVTSDPARFAELRRGVTPQQLEQLFALDTAGLRKGGTDLKGGATLAGALLAGTGELAPAKTVQAVIRARRDANWGQGRSKPPLNAAASSLEEKRRKAGSAVQRPEKRQREEREAADQQAHHEAARQAHDDALAQVRRLSRVALTRPHVTELREAEAWLAAHADAPALPPGLDQRLADARGAVAAARAAQDGAQRTLARAREAADRIARDAAASACAERLAPLPGMLGEAEKAARDIVERRAEYAARLEDVRTALRDIGAAVPPEAAHDVVPTMGVMASARAAITAEAGLRTAIGRARDTASRARTTLETLQSAPSPISVLPEGLVALLGEIRADRNPVQHEAELAARARATATEVTRAFALVPGWTGTSAALRALALPSEPTYERRDAARQAAAANERAARAHRTDLAAADTADRTALRALHERPLPDAASIAAARAARDHGMRLVLRRAFAAPPSAAEEDQYAAGEPVAVVYERQVRAADALADRRTAELERVQEAERLGRLVAARAVPLAQAEADEAGAVAALGAAGQAWADAVVPLGLDPAATMPELRAALAARLRLIGAMAEADEAAAAEAALRNVHAQWASRLASLLAVPPAPLAAVLSRADALVTASRAAEHAGLKRQTELEAAGRALREATDEQTKADRALRDWHDGWARLLERLQRPADESPEAVAAVLDGIAVLDRHHRAAVSLQRRIDDMQADLAGFADRVAGLAAALREPAASPPAETARALIARAHAAAAAESAWREAQRGVARAEAEATVAAAALAKAADAVDAVVAACGATDADAAEARIAASRAHAEQTARRDAARKALLGHGDGLPHAVLEAEADATSAEELTARRREAEAAAAAAAIAAETAAVRLDQLRTALAGEDDTSAVDARADYEAASAEFGRRLEEQLVLTLAGSMLGTALRAVEETMSGSSLARLSQEFAGVTGGAYGLATHEGSEGEELHAIEHAYPQERKTLDELSEGTRDQLYLALRMVALRDHCASATPLPFIADDILQTFDDARAEATLRALAELSRTLQVIVLTHHAHLGTIAARLGAERVHLLSL